MENHVERELLNSFNRNNRWNFGLAFFFIILDGLVMLVIAWLLAASIDAITNASLEGLKEVAIIMALVVPSFWIVGVFEKKYMAKYVHKGLKQYKDVAFEKLSEKSIRAFVLENTSTYLSTLTNDASSVETNYLSTTLFIYYQGVQFLFALCMMFYYSWILTLSVLLLCLLPLFISLIMGKGLVKREEKVSELNEGFTGRLKDLLTGYPIIKSFRAESQAKRLFLESNEGLEVAKEDRREYTSRMSTSAMSSSILLQFTIFLLGAFLAIRGDVTAGTVLLFVQLCNYIVFPLQVLPGYFAGRKASRALVKKLAELIDKNRDREGREELPGLKQGICFDNVSFSYDEEHTILKDLSLELEAGKCYAVVGASGSGKSSLLNLLLGGLETTGGSIRLDGKDIRDISSDSLYRLIGHMSQDVFLFDDTIQANITMFSDFPKEEVEAVIERARLSKIIAERGEHYLCGENGNKLSGGEKQRIAIARSLLKKSDLLLADEFSSSLDAETAYQITSDILGLEGITRIIVTHALEAALLKKYDAILVLKDGRIEERGSFDELMENKAYFYALYTVAQ